MHHLAGYQLLAQQSDRHLRDRDGIGRIEPKIRSDGGVRLASDVADGHLRQRQRARPGDVERTGVQHHRRGDVVERARLQQQSLAAARLLGGGADQHDREVQFVGDVGQRERGADRGRGDDVVPAGVPDPWQGVVFGADADDQRPAAEVGAERGVQTSGLAGDRKAALGDEGLGLGAAAVFVERQFRLGVDRVRQLDQVTATSLDGVLDGRRRCGGRHRRSISPRTSALRASFT